MRGGVSPRWEVFVTLTVSRWLCSCQCVVTSRGQMSLSRSLFYTGLVDMVFSYEAPGLMKLSRI